MAAMGYELRERLFRLKSIGADFLETQMKRCLSTFDITLLGIGHMIGAGIYVLTGSVVRNTAGPGIVLSFIFAGIASLLSALCYAEFGARVPKAGSAYTYTYITVGEFWAFIIGWNIILEHMLGAAAVARSWSGYLDSLLGHVIRNATVANVGSMKDGSSLFGDYPDIIAFLVVIIVAVFMGYGAKTSTNFNTIFTFINMAVILFVVVFGFSFADFSLWSGTDPKTGNSRFMPMGFNGVLVGAASCFFAYIGFDGLATAGEEASDPGRSIPIATFVSMSIVTGSYVLMSAALTLMIPYWQVHPTAAFSDAFETRGALWAKYIVAIGALSGMTTSLVGSMFALPRCVYAMAKDGLIFKSLAQIHPKTQVPTYAVLVFGAATAVIALVFDIETLVQFLSIGTLMAYTIVSGSVIILRYQPSREPDKEQSGVQTVHVSISLVGFGRFYGYARDVVRRRCGVSMETTKPTNEIETTKEDTAMLVADNLAGKPRPFVPSLLRPLMERFVPGSLVTWSVLGMVCSNLLLSATLSNGDMHVMGHLFLCILFASSSFFWFAVIYAHHQNEAPLNFKVPLVPLVPALSVLINVLLMSHLATLTWIRLGIWLSIGFCIYFFYGMKHSVENATAHIPKSTTYDTMVVTPATTPGGGDPPKADISYEKPQPVDKKY